MTRFVVAYGNTPFIIRQGVLPYATTFAIIKMNTLNLSIGAQIMPMMDLHIAGML